MLDSQPGLRNQWLSYINQRRTKEKERDDKRYDDNDECEEKPTYHYVSDSDDDDGERMKSINQDMAAIRFMFRFVREVFDAMTSEHHILLDAWFTSKKTTKRYSLRYLLLKMSDELVKLFPRNNKETEEIRERWKKIHDKITELEAAHKTPAPSILHQVAIAGLIAIVIFNSPTIYARLGLILGTLILTIVLWVVFYVVNKILYLGSILNVNCYNHEHYRKQSVEHKRVLENNLLKLWKEKV